MSNLLDNARKWSPHGGTIEVELHDGTLSVRDHGPGFHDEDLPFVFDRFHRARDARSKPGSGLGLAIVRQAAEAHGGFVDGGERARRRGADADQLWAGARARSAGVRAGCQRALTGARHDPRLRPAGVTVTATAEAPGHEAICSSDAPRREMIAPPTV